MGIKNIFYSMITNPWSCPRNPSHRVRHVGLGADADVPTGGPEPRGDLDKWWAVTDCFSACGF